MDKVSQVQLSVIIPTLNGGELFADLMRKLSQQAVTVGEILVVDSTSNDHTCKVARDYGARVISVARTDFDHGATRSMAAKEATGELLLFFTQDAVPAGDNLIENLIAPLLKDKTVAICYGRQLPQPGATLSAAALRNFNYPEQSVVREFADREKLGLKTVFVSNSCAAYRKTALEEVAFFPEKLIFGEDTCTAGRLLQKGYKVAYVAEAEVYHSHNYSLSEEFRRSFDIGVLHAIEHWLPDTFGRAEGEGLRYIKYELGVILQQKKIHLLPLFFCRNLTKFIGYKFGSKYDILPRWLLPHLSMNSGWWRPYVP